jgi:hypothetical protein
MGDEPQGSGGPVGPTERAAKEVVSSAGIRFEDYLTDWFTSYDAALNGDYDATRLVSDATRMTSRLFRDTAKLIFSGFRAAQILAEGVSASTTAAEASLASPETTPPAKARPSTPKTPS